MMDYRYTRSHILERRERKWVIDFAVKLWCDAKKTGRELGAFKNGYETTKRQKYLWENVVKLTIGHLAIIPS